MKNLNIKHIVESTIYKLFEDDNDEVTETDLESEGVELTKDCVLGFSKGNEKLEWPYFSLPAGYSCPFATMCKNMPAKWEGPIKGGSFKKPASWEKNVKPGPKAKFMCYAARAQGQYPGANIQAFSNLNLLKKLKTSREMADLIVRSMRFHKIDNTDIIRVHEAGDFFSQTYFDAWMETARRLPNTLFYAYTTSLPFWVARMGSIPANFKLIASMDEENEEYIYDNNLRYSKVVNSEEEAEELGLRIDADDSIAFGSDEDFALLIHGPQPKGSEAAQALKQNKLSGAYDRIKQAKELNQDTKDELRDRIKRELRSDDLTESEENDFDWISDISSGLQHPWVIFLKRNRCKTTDGNKELQRFLFNLGYVNAYSANQTIHNGRKIGIRSYDGLTHTHPDYKAFVLLFSEDDVKSGTNVYYWGDLKKNVVIGESEEDDFDWIREIPKSLKTPWAIMITNENNWEQIQSYLYNLGYKWNDGLNSDYYYPSFNLNSVINKNGFALTNSGGERFGYFRIDYDNELKESYGNDITIYRDTDLLNNKITESVSDEWGSDDVSLQGHKNYPNWVFIHRNLHKPPYWSIKSGRSGGPVIGYDTDIWLTDVTFKVQSGGRDKVRREKQKNVHAGVVGKIKESGGKYDTTGWTLVTYNPYLNDTFVEYETGRPVTSAREAILKNTKEVWVR